MFYSQSPVSYSTATPVAAPATLTALDARTDALDACTVAAPWLSFDLPPVTHRKGSHAIRERRLFISPFSDLTLLDCPSLGARDVVVVASPMSGHHSLLARDLFVALTRTHDVAVMDWTDAREVPLAQGGFGFSDNIAEIIRVTRFIERITDVRPHLLGICQGGVPAIAAATVLHAADDRAAPASIALLSAPIDPQAAPSRVSQALKATSLAQLEKSALSTVRSSHRGAGRRVYPAATHRNGLMAYLNRQVWRGGPLARKMMLDDGQDPVRHPFYAAYTQVKDLPGEAFLGNIDVVFQRRAIWDGTLDVGGDKLKPAAVQRCALMTVECADDDVACPGQTAAAHELLPSIHHDHRVRLMMPGGGHFALLHGQLCRQSVAPGLAAFFDAARQVDAAPRRQPRRPRRAQLQ